MAVPLCALEAIRVDCFNFLVNITRQREKAKERRRRTRSLTAKSDLYSLDNETVSLREGRHTDPEVLVQFIYSHLSRLTLSFYLKYKRKNGTVLLI